MLNAKSNFLRSQCFPGCVICKGDYYPKSEIDIGQNSNPPLRQGRLLFKDVICKGGGFMWRTARIDRALRLKEQG